MIWLQEPQWVRWALACFVVIGTLWVELGDQGEVEHPFTTAQVAPGEPFTSSNVELRQVPEGMLEPVDLAGFSTRSFAPGEPLVPSAVATEPDVVRGDWWSLEVDLPHGAHIGDPVQLVLLDTGEVIPGVVSALSDEDALGPGTGAVALPPDSAASAAAAVASGRFAVLVSTG